MTVATREKILHGSFLISAWLREALGCWRLWQEFRFPLLLRKLSELSLFGSPLQSCLKIRMIGLPRLLAVPSNTSLPIPRYLRALIFSFTA